MKTNGPKIAIKMSCFDCQYEHTERYCVQGDSGRDVYCTHGGTHRRIGDTTWETPSWCPMKPPDMSDACTPRKPESEWFEKWDSWWIRVTGGKYGGTVDIVSVVDVYQLHKDSDPWVERDGWCITVDGYSFTNNAIYADDIECVPVAREGFPAPVGWHVVGG